MSLFLVLKVVIKLNIYLVLSLNSQKYEFIGFLSAIRASFVYTLYKLHYGLIECAIHENIEKHVFLVHFALQNSHISAQCQPFLSFHLHQATRQVGCSSSAAFGDCTIR